ncbi:LOW QUALITY PROTEIN: myosin-11-like [Saccostrea cucullata]|uniref:LOW QUALITY PROTEIN: myosin-11-like n=1 Tax=Saccostrea cuccullata TaxID=36930 RepID=UPI002ED0140C
MSCTSKRSMPRDETEDLPILRLTIKRLEDLENAKTMKGKDRRKLDISELDNQILANIKTMEKHFRHYLESNGYSNNSEMWPCIHQSPVSPDQEESSPVNLSLIDVINKLESDIKHLEDDCQEYKLRIRSLQESEDRHIKTINCLRKELQTSETCQYKLSDEIEHLKQKINQLEDRLSLKAEEMDRTIKEYERNEERLNTKIKEVEGDIQTYRVALINLNTKHTRTEADCLKIEGECAEKCREVRRLQHQLKDVEEKLKRYQEAAHIMNKTNYVSDQKEDILEDKQTFSIIQDDFRKCSAKYENKYDEILSCMSSLLVHQWSDTRKYLVAKGHNEYQIINLLGKIMHVAYVECRKKLNRCVDQKLEMDMIRRQTSHEYEFPKPPRLFDLSIKTVEANSKLILSDIYKIVDKSWMLEFDDVDVCRAVDIFKELSIITFWRMAAKFKEVRLDWNCLKDNTKDIQTSDAQNVFLWPGVYEMKS